MRPSTALRATFVSSVLLALAGAPSCSASNENPTKTSTSASSGGGLGGSGGEGATSTTTSGTGGADACPDDPNQAVDADGDGVCDEIDDACPNDPEQWTDADGDGVCDEVSDGCPDDAGQSLDADGDGFCDELDDDCPQDPAGHKDTNNDGVCDGNDDNDGDGVSNGEEAANGVDCAISDPELADSDEDGVDDNQDPYPLDPYPEYILHRNDLGTIDLMLSNRDGTFQPPVEIGKAFGCTNDAPHNCPEDPAYRYVAFVVTDFDNDGRVDFLALGDKDPVDTANPRDLWWFARTGSFSSGNLTTFQQRLVDANVTENMFGTAADLTNDERIDLVAMDVVKPSYISNAYLYSYENTGLVGSANCAYSADPANPNGCAFIRRLAVDLSTWANNQWIVRSSGDAVDVDGDGFRDMAIYSLSSGGNVSVPVYIVSGNGDGTFDPPGAALFSHSTAGCGASPANSILFADFNADNLGDVIIGFDDDGDPGSAWFYPGKLNGSTFSFDFAQCKEALDINPGNESGSDQPGATGASRPFDFNFDGFQDIMVGYRYQSATQPPTRTELYLGKGDGSFQSPLIVRDFPTTDFGSSFATPQRLCSWFPIAAP